MGILSTYYPKYNNIKYLQPERITPSEARQRRLQGQLQKARKALEDEPSRLSPANKFYTTQLKKFEDKFAAELVARRARMNEELRKNPSLVRSGTKKSALSKLLQLEGMHRILRERAAAERHKNSFQASAVDRRLYSPYKQSFKTVFGTDAWTRASSLKKQSFRTPGVAIPCVQRLVRREVMFAKKHGGKGHRTKKRFTMASMIGC